MLYSRSLNSFTHEPPVLARLESHTPMLPRCQDPQVHKARTIVSCRLRALAHDTHAVTYIHVRVNIRYCSAR